MTTERVEKATARPIQADRYALSQRPGSIRIKDVRLGRSFRCDVCKVSSRLVATEAHQPLSSFGDARARTQMGRQRAQLKDQEEVVAFIILYHMGCEKRTNIF